MSDPIINFDPNEEKSFNSIVFSNYTDEQKKKIFELYLSFISNLEKELNVKISSIEIKDINGIVNFSIILKNSTNKIEMSINVLKTNGNHEKNVD